MSKELHDAAFRTLTTSLDPTKSTFPLLETDEDRIAYLKSRFLGVPQDIIDEAFAIGKRLEGLAVNLVDADRSREDGGQGNPMTLKTLAEQCPGFSLETYSLAMSYGYLMTRK